MPRVLVPVGSVVLSEKEIAEMRSVKRAHDAYLHAIREMGHRASAMRIVSDRGSEYAEGWLGYQREFNTAVIAAPLEGET